MNTCDTCQWWEPRDPKPYVPEQGLCTNLKLHRTPLNLEPDSLSTNDGIYGFGTPRTGPKFGCNHWEKE